MDCWLSPFLQTKSTIRHYCVLLLLISILNTGCNDSSGSRSIALFDTGNRSVATLYKIRTTPPETRVACYLLQNNSVEILTTLQKNELVEIVAIEEGLLPYDGQLWLRIYPPLSHRPNCYVNVDNLIPYG